MSVKYMCTYVCLPKYSVVLRRQARTFVMTESLLIVFIYVSSFHKYFKDFLTDIVTYNNLFSVSLIPFTLFDPVLGS